MITELNSHFKGVEPSFNGDSFSIGSERVAKPKDSIKIRCYDGGNDDAVGAWCVIKSLQQAQL